MINRAILFHALAAIASLVGLVGCVSNPVERRSEIQRTRSITIICCDATSAAAVVSGNGIYTGALLGLGGGVLGAAGARSGLSGTNDKRTTEFLRRAGQVELPLATNFVSALTEELSARGYKVASIFPRGYDGYSNRYQTSPGEIATGLVLEIRHAGHIADYKDRFLPTLAAGFSVRRAADYATLNSGFVATRDVSIPPPPFGDPNVVRAPMLTVMGPIAHVFRTAEFLTLDDSQIVHGEDSALFTNAAKLYDGTLRANRELARLLISKLDDVKQ